MDQEIHRPTGGGILRALDASRICCGEERIKYERKFVNLPTNLHSYPYLWPQAGGSDRKLSK